MTLTAEHRRHAAKVAAGATAVVLICYVVAVVVLNVLVVHRLTAQADARLSEHLVEAQKAAQSGSGPPARATHERDIDDAPLFVWSVAPAGGTTALTSGAPSLPRHAWSNGLTTMEAGGTSFRFQAARSGSGWLVAGESIGQIARVQGALLVPEILVGSAAMVLVFAGALVIGLRASAPLEVVRRRQSEFTADASHELRTPLSVIEAEVDLALSRPRDGAAYRAVLERVGGEGRRLRSIVNDLLWLARADDVEGSGEVGRTAVDVAAIAGACVDRFQAVALTREVELRFVGPPGGTALLQAQPEWIDRLVGVLVDNAIRYAGPHGRAEVHVHIHGPRTVLEVDDSGPGIPPEDRAAVFDRFHRGTDAPGGTGLGLAIADSVVRATEGAWSIKSSRLGGAQMEVSWGRQARSPGGRPPRTPTWQCPLAVTGTATDVPAPTP
jgi:signal transduction histidine kinase